MPTILGHAILQLLSRNTASGYDLKGRFHGSVGHGWHAYDTQIYRELRNLEKEGFVSGQMAPGRSGPQRRLYSITEKGIESLESWLTSPLDVTKMKDEFALRVWTADLFPEESINNHLDGARSQWSEALAHQKMSLRVLTEEYGKPTDSDDTVYGRQLAIQYSIAITEAKLAWVDEAQRIARRRAKAKNRTARRA
ncbi:helix-turn-helix transcriptional regulator [Actinomadura sp. LOL_016]|uniref:helix-turn-helix transcriptional regulator n=1 Tax=unclassified Actinomadura TaxID=2626254 RepID=UPI003A7F7975